MKTLRKQVRSAMHIRSLCLVPALLLVPIAARADYFIDGEGKGQAFCEAILTALNKSKPTQERRPCISEEILKLPGVTDPAWEKLDLSQHEELAREMLTLSAVGSQEYFRVKKLAPDMYPTILGKQRMLEHAMQGGAELFALRLTSELSGDKALVTLRYQEPRCGMPFDRRGETSRNAWVTSDLKEIATGPGLFDSNGGRPLVHRGRLYLMRAYAAGEGIEVFVPRSATLIRACNIRFTGGITFKGEKK